MANQVQPDFSMENININDQVIHRNGEMSVVEFIAHMPDDTHSPDYPYVMKLAGLQPATYRETGRFNVSESCADIVGVKKHTPISLANTQVMLFLEVEATKRESLEQYRGLTMQAAEARLHANGIDPDFYYFSSLNELAANVNNDGNFGDHWLVVLGDKTA